MRATLLNFAPLSLSALAFKQPQALVKVKEHTMDTTTGEIDPPSIARHLLPWVLSVS